MPRYIVTAKVTLVDEESGRTVTWADDSYAFTAEKADGGHPAYQALWDAIADTVERLERELRPPHDPTRKDEQ
jgi:hypothetical protein